ncbi:MAG: FMN-binding protein [Actinobacteria bacterium]|nr:FMN-binding protein [Actinomycetota bacterium]
MKQQTPVSLARRVWPALAVAGASAAFVSALDHPTQFVTDTVSLTGAVDPNTPATLLSVPALETTTVPSAPVDPNAPVATVPPVPVTAPPVAAAPACGAPIAGPVVNTRWGPVQVQASLTPDRVVCDVSALQTPNSHSRSVRINNYATPILHDRVLSAGNTRINGVSGATITSRGYVASLQSILDNA